MGAGDFKMHGPDSSSCLCCVGSSCAIGLHGLLSLRTSTNFEILGHNLILFLCEKAVH